MWTSDNKSRHLRRISQKSGLGSVVHDSDRPRYNLTKEDIVPMKVTASITLSVLQLLPTIITDWIDGALLS